MVGLKATWIAFGTALSSSIDQWGDLGEACATVSALNRLQGLKNLFYLLLGATGGRVGCLKCSLALKFYYS